MKEFEDILEEVRGFEAPAMLDGIVANPDEQGGEAVEPVTLWGESDIFAAILKAVALMTVVGASGYFKLMSPVLYIPILVVCFGFICYKFGEFHGRTDA